MASIVDQKRKVFGNIAALTTLNNGLPTLKLSSSFPSINNGGNSLQFLSDLLKALVGYEKLRGIVSNIIVHNLDNIEHDIKKALKSELKSLVNCGVNPSIPTFLKYGQPGINIKVPQVDFFDILLTNPNTISGKLIYDDVSGGLTSTDFNTFLYNTIQTDTIPQDWGAVTSPNDILNIRFDSVGAGLIPNNTLTITASNYYTANNKTLTDLNNDYIDSVKLFGTEKVINNIIDSLFGSVSVNLNKSNKQLENEEKLQTIIDCIINSDGDDVIDDTYFEFSNEDVLNQQNRANERKRGVRKLVTCGDMEVSIPTQFLVDIQNGLNTATTVSQKSDVINTNINNMATFTSLYTQNTQDRQTIQLNFIQELLNKLTHAIVNIIMSPKIITIFLVNYKIIYGSNATYDNAIDFLKKNKTLINEMMQAVRNSIIQTLTKTALKEISTLVGATAIKLQTERSKLSLARLLSLVGIPQETIRIIQGLA